MSLCGSVDILTSGDIRIGGKLLREVGHGLRWGFHQAGKGEKRAGGTLFASAQDDPALRSRGAAHAFAWRDAFPSSCEPAFDDRTGPAPAPVRSTARAISSKSFALSCTFAAATHASTCSGLRAPTIAPVTPGHASVHATATAEMETRWRSATGRSASRNSRLFFRFGC